MKKLIVSTFILLLTIGAGEFSAQSILERLGKATQKAKSTIAKLDKTKMYTQEQADSYYPLYNLRTIHFDEDFVARERLTGAEGPIDFWIKGGYDLRSDKYRQRTLNLNKLIITINDKISWEYLGYRLHNLKEVWYGPDVDVAAILQKHV